MQPHPIRVIALCSLILGTFFLAKSISFKTPKYVLHELLDFKVNKSRFFRRYVNQKLEAIIGFLFMFLGFALMIFLEVEALRELEMETAAEHTALTDWWAVIGITIGAMLAITVALNRVTRFFSGRIFVELVRFMVSNHDFPLERDQGLVLELGRIMRVKRDDDDTVESYGDKVREKMKLPVDDRSGRLPY